MSGDYPVIGTVRPDRFTVLLLDAGRSVIGTDRHAPTWRVASYGATQEDAEREVGRFGVGMSGRPPEHRIVPPR